MEKSVLKHTGWLMLIVVALLLLMSLLPGATIGRYVLRRVDILGDVRPVPEVVSEPDVCCRHPDSEAGLCRHLSRRHDLH